jgi:hypothetical protein
LFIGVATFLRIDDSNREEILWVSAMNQIRHGYVTMVPAIANRFVSGVTDDLTGIARSYGLQPGAGYSIFHFFVTVPGMIAVVDGVIAGVFAATALGQVGIPTIGLGALALVTGIAMTLLLLGIRSRRQFDRFVAAQQP